MAILTVLKKLLLATAILLASFLILLTIPALAQEKDSASLRADFVVANNRPDILKKFLLSYHSPLAPYADDLVRAADKYGIDWRLVPAITGVESSFGRRIPPNSHNAYGWNNGDYRFSSWESSIDHVCRVLKEKYIDRGLNNPYKIAPVYAPPSATWGQKVDFFMKKIDLFSLTLLL